MIEFKREFLLTRLLYLLTLRVLVTLFIRHLEKILTRTHSRNIIVGFDKTERGREVEE